MKKLIAILLFIPHVAFSQNKEPILFPLFTFPAGSAIDPLEITTDDSVIILSNICQNERFEVLGFSVDFKGFGVDIIRSYNYGNKFNPELIDIMKRMPVNSIVYCYDFMVFTGTDTLISTQETMFRTDCLKACIFAFPDDIETRFRACLDSNEIRIIGKELIKSDGNISSKNLLHNHHILVAKKETDDSGFDINTDYQIVQYDIIMEDSDRMLIAKISTQGDSIPKKAKRLIRRNMRIRYIEINNVVASDASGKLVNIGSLWLRVM